MGNINTTAKVSIVSIGDELLIGQITNTNASWMAMRLNANGFEVIQILTAADEPCSIFKNLDIASENSDLVLVTGGLGPTKDDITKQAICSYFNTELELDEEILHEVTEFFIKRNRTLTELNRNQALVPKACSTIKNKVGTAPGMYFQKDNVHFVFMPGVPFEMKYIMENWVIPQMKQQLKTQNIFQKTVLTHGLGESFLADLISDWENHLPKNISLAYLPSPGKVRLRLRATGNNTAEELRETVENEIASLQKLAGKYIYGYDDETMETIIGQLLRQCGRTLSIAESCTGGYISHLITEVAGSSGYFNGGIVAYANEAKTEILGVEAGIIEKYGAVSAEVAKEMAIGVREKLKTDFGLATTGIAGPDGGTDEKPVGTVYIALATEYQVITKLFHFGDHRLRNINMTALSALNMLRMKLLNIPLV